MTRGPVTVVTIFVVVVVPWQTLCAPEDEFVLLQGSVEREDPLTGPIFYSLGDEQGGPLCVQGPPNELKHVFIRLTQDGFFQWQNPVVQEGTCKDHGHGFGCFTVEEGTQLSQCFSDQKHSLAWMFLKAAKEPDKLEANKATIAKELRAMGSPDILPDPSYR